MNRCFSHFGFINIKLSFYKIHPLIDGGYLKFDRVICFQIETLVTYHSIGNRMGFAKGTACKRFHLPVIVFKSFFVQVIFSNLNM
jgi:hypothetical protein